MQNQNSNARRQARYRQNMQTSKGLKLVRFWVRDADFRTGAEAFARGRNMVPPMGVDAHSWCLGYAAARGKTSPFTLDQTIFHPSYLGRKSND